MSLFRILLVRHFHHHPSTQSPPLLLLSRSFAFSSAEEAAAERRRRKRRLRIEPPLHALRREPSAPPPPRDPNAPRLPDSTSALVGLRLSLHNRVQSLIRAFDLDAASAVARHSVFSSTRPTVFTCNAIIASMYRAKRYSDAIALFHFFFNQANIVPNVVSYNNLINTYCDMGDVDKGLEIFRHIIENAPFSPSSVTYRHLTKGLIDAGRIDEAVDLLRQMLDKGHSADSLVYNNLIKGFLELGNLEKAEELFDELKQRCVVYDGVVSATFMEWYFKQGKEREALESYKSLLDKKFRMVPATCNVLLEVLLRYGQNKQAWDMFERMLDDHTPPNFQAVNSDTYNLFVNYFFKEGKIDEALGTFRKVGTKPTCRPFLMDLAGYNNMIVRYCEHGLLEEGYGMYNELTSKSLCPDVTSHRSLIEASLKAEKFDNALVVLHKMVDANLWVVASFGSKVFEDLIKGGKAVDCAQVLVKMSEKDRKPDPMCYEVVLKGLCNTKALDEAINVTEQMVKNGIGFTPSLCQVLTTAFGEAGRHEEIDRQLNTNRWGNVPRYPPQRGGSPASSQSAGPQFFRSPPNSPQQMNIGVPPNYMQGGVRTSAASQIASSPSISQMSGAPSSSPYDSGLPVSSPVARPLGYAQASSSPYMSQSSDPQNPSPYDNEQYVSHQGNVAQDRPSQMVGLSGHFQAAGLQYMSQMSGAPNPSPYNNGGQVPRMNMAQRVSCGAAEQSGSVSLPSNDQQPQQQQSEFSQVAA